MSANKKQHGGDHYKKLKIEPWDFIVENNLPYLEGNIIKYVARWRSKGGVQDLLKAQHYLEKLLETERAKKPPTVSIGPAVFDSDVELDKEPIYSFFHNGNQLAGVAASSFDVLEVRVLCDGIERQVWTSYEWANGWIRPSAQVNQTSLDKQPIYSFFHNDNRLAGVSASPSDVLEVRVLRDGVASQVWTSYGWAASCV